ncbi:MAG: HAD-IA family hydrolase [Candidatus Uhrbacteria bacterium]
MSPKTLIFDFDGTLADTLDAAVKIYNDLAPKFHCRTINLADKEELRNKRPQELFKIFGIAWFKLPFLLFKIQKELHKQIETIKPTENIVETLKSLKTLGFNLGILTSNTKENVAAFLIKNDLTNIFDFIHSDRNFFGKHKAMSHCLKNQNLSTDSVIYIGDETRDIEAAKKANLKIIAVSWGFNSQEALIRTEPDGIVDKPEELLKTLEKI